MFSPPSQSELSLISAAHEREPFVFSWAGWRPAGRIHTDKDLICVVTVASCNIMTKFPCTSPPGVLFHRLCASLGDRKRGGGVMEPAFLTGTFIKCWAPVCVTSTFSWDMRSAVPWISPNVETQNLIFFFTRGVWKEREEGGEKTD